MFTNSYQNLYEELKHLQKLKIPVRTQNPTQLQTRNISLLRRQHLQSTAVSATQYE